MYLALEHGHPRFPQELAVSRGTQELLERFLVLSTRLSLSLAPYSEGFDYQPPSHIGALQPPSIKLRVWAFPLSLAATDGISMISFPLGTKMFQFPRCPFARLWIQHGIGRKFDLGSPIRRPPDHRLLATFPVLFASGNVLHRHQQPRHPLFALIRVAFFIKTLLTFYSLFKGLVRISLLRWTEAGSNRWPPVCKTGALPAELSAQTKKLAEPARAG